MEPSRTAALIKRLKERTFASLAGGDEPTIDVSNAADDEFVVDVRTKHDTPTDEPEPS